MADQGGIGTALGMILLGFAARKFGIISPKLLDCLPELLFQLCYPAMILKTVAGFSPVQLIEKGGAIILFTWIAGLLIFYLATLYLRKYPAKRGREKLLRLNLLAGNITFVGIPFIQLLFGAEGVAFAVLHGTAQDFLIWTIGYGQFFYPDLSVARLKGGPKAFIRKEAVHGIFNPCFVALVAGGLMAAMGITLPASFLSLIDGLNATVSPVALILIGGMLCENRRYFFHPSRESILLAAAKTVCLPLVTLLILWGLPLERKEVILSALMLGMPFPLLSVVFARRFGQDEGYAVSGFVWSTVFFLVLYGVGILIQRMTNG